MMSSGIGIATIIIIFFVILMLLSMPISVAMSISGIVGIFLYLQNWAASFSAFSAAIVSTFTSYSMVVIPMFMMMGELASEAGIGGNLFSSLKILTGRQNAGLACAVQVVCAFFGAICGSGSATAAMMCRVAYPEMKRHGYSKELATGCIASGSCLATLIPPSSLLMNYGIIVNESIGKLFLGGIFVGIVLMFLFIFTIQIWCKIDKTLAPPAEKYSAKEKLQAIKDGNFVELLIIFGISMGGMFLGVFTPTEAGGVGVAIMLLVTFIEHRMDFKKLMKACKNTLVATGMIYCMLAGASVMGKFFTLTRFAETIANGVAGLHLSGLLIVVVITLIYLVLGCFIDSLPLTLLTAPIFLPIVQQFGYSAIWFGVYVVVVMGLASITPPVGISCYVVQGFCDNDVPLQNVFKGCIPFIFTFLVMVLMMALFPGLATWLPSLSA